ncbi:MAG TPA: hypothetical protein VGI98_08230 [Candidatus Limnocylindrales bacterium]
MTDPERSAPPRSCQWCGTVTVEPTATTCAGCGAALGERDDLGGLVIPGVTSVDPALQAYDAQPLRLTRPSASQSMAGSAIVAAAAGGPAGLAALGGLAAIVAVEYLGTGSGSGGRRVSLDELGNPSEAARMMVDRLNSGAAAAEGVEPGEGRNPARAGDKPSAEPARPASGERAPGDTTL